MSAGFGMSGFHSLMFAIAPIFIIVIFVAVVGVFVVTAVRGAAAWSRNNASPRLTVPAQVVAKRTDVTYHRHQAHGSHHGGMGAGHMTASTRCYATFQVESGDRMELQVSGPEFGMLAEGDEGMLSFQGTRYLGFERT